ADPDGVCAIEPPCSHPLVEALPQLGDAVRAIRSHVTHVGDAVGRDLFDVYAHRGLLDSFARSIGPATGSCFAVVANLFAWLAIRHLAVAPALGAPIAPLGGAHAEMRAERARKGGRRREPVIQRYLEDVPIAAAQERPGCLLDPLAVNEFEE